MSLKSVCVFCGASPGARPIYHEAAAQLGRHIAERGLTLVVVTHDSAVARRAERDVIRLLETEEANAQVQVYLNRVSDLLFIMSRAANQSAGLSEQALQLAPDRGITVQRPVQPGEATQQCVVHRPGPDALQGQQVFGNDLGWRISLPLIER